MSLESMKKRLNRHGGEHFQDRMIRDKRRSLRLAIKSSYQAARFSKYLEEDSEQVGLLTPVSHTLDYDTKRISIEYSAKYNVGDIFKWNNTGYYWIIYQWDRSELAYFRGQCRRCDWKVSWVDKNREVQETLVSIIGPSNAQFKSTSSLDGLATDIPNGRIVVMTQNNKKNKEYFHRYQTFLVSGVSYRVETIDVLSMPGVLWISAIEHYTNEVEDSPEENLGNAWNVQPVIPDEKLYPTRHDIIGPRIIKPTFEFRFNISGDVAGKWRIKENLLSKTRPVIFTTDPAAKEVTLKWTTMNAGNFTLEYVTDETVYQLYVVVESLM